MGNDLVAKLGVDSTAWDKGFKAARSTASNFSSGLGALFSPAIAGIAAATAGALGAAASVGAYKESITGQAKLAAVLTSTGGAAEQSVASITSFASELQSLTNFEDDATVGAASVLAAFTNVKGVTFTDTLKSAADLSTVMGGDLAGNAKLLGQALNDPAEGLGRLRKAGVQFTDQQEEEIKAMAKAGNMAEAQAAILAQVQGRFGGAAEAVADPWTQLTNSIGDLSENFGALLLPSIDAVSSRMTAVLGPINEFTTSFVDIGIEAAVSLQTIGDLATSATTSLLNTLAPAVDFIGETFNGLFGVVGGGSTTFQDFVTETAVVMENLGGIVDLSLQQWGLFFVQIGAEAAHYFTDVIPGYVSWFADNWQSMLVTTGNNVLKLFDNIGANIKAVWDSIVGYFSGNEIEFNFTDLTTGFENAVKTLPDIPPRAISELERGLESSIEHATNALAESMTASRERITNLADDRRQQAETRYNPESKVAGSGIRQIKEDQSVGKLSENKVALFGSQEALKIASGAGLNKMQKLAEDQLAEARKIHGVLQVIADKNPSDGSDIPNG